MSENNVEETKAITWEYIEEKLRNVALEDIEPEDVFHRYIGYGDDEELRNPEIQRLLVKHRIYRRTYGSCTYCYK